MSKWDALDPTDKHFLIAYQRAVSKMRAYENYVQMKEAEEHARKLHQK